MNPRTRVPVYPRRIKVFILYFGTFRFVGYRYKQLEDVSDCLKNQEPVPPIHLTLKRPAMLCFSQGVGVFHFKQTWRSQENSPTS